MLQDTWASSFECHGGKGLRDPLEMSISRIRLAESGAGCYATEETPTSRFEPDQIARINPWESLGRRHAVTAFESHAMAMSRLRDVNPWPPFK